MPKMMDYKYYLRNVPLKNNYINALGYPNPTYKSVIRLLKVCKINQLKTIKDYQKLGERVILLFGCHELMQDFFLHKIVFKFNKIKGVPLDIDYSEGVLISSLLGEEIEIYTSVMKELLGIDLYNFEYLDDDAFNEYAFKKKQFMWYIKYKEEHTFPGYIKNGILSKYDPLSDEELINYSLIFSKSIVKEVFGEVI